VSFFLVCKKKKRVSRYAREISTRIGNEIDARVALPYRKRQERWRAPVKLGSFRKRLIPAHAAATGRTSFTSRKGRIVENRDTFNFENAFFEQLQPLR
jgi:hypothetical protein